MRAIRCKVCGKITNTKDAIMALEGKHKCYFCDETERDAYFKRKEEMEIKAKCYEVIYSITGRVIPIVYKMLIELNNTYSWDSILVALNKVKPYIEKCFNEGVTDYAFARYIQTSINNTYDKETNKIEKVKFHIIKNSKKLADTLSYILNENYYEFDDKFNEGWKCYSFKESEKLLNALDDIKKLKEKYESH